MNSDDDEVLSQIAVPVRSKRSQRVENSADNKAEARVGTDHLYWMSGRVGLSENFDLVGRVGRVGSGHLVGRLSGFFGVIFAGKNDKNCPKIRKRFFFGPSFM